MADIRRYSESEIEQIFERALEPGHVGGGAPDRDGLTLAELQEIGREVGILPERVAAAASSLDLSVDRSIDRGITRRVAGLPLSVSHTVPLPRDPNEAEWERLVADLRRTFAARGRIDTHGSLRMWSNGNLHAAVEPGDDGPILRMGTTKGSARQFFYVGSTALLVAVVFLLMFVTGIAGERNVLGAAGFVSAIGAGLLAYGGIPLPAWARERRDQMEGVGDRFAALLAAEPESGS